MSKCASEQHEQHERSTPKSIFDWIRLHSLGDLEARWTEAAIEQVVESKIDQHFDELVEQCTPSFWRRELPVHSVTRFGRLRRAALRMGTIRYGSLGWARQKCIPSAVSRLGGYERDGNLERLVDAYNLIVLEWIRPNQEGTCWRYASGQPVGRVQLEQCPSSLHIYQLGGRREHLVAAAAGVLAEWCYPYHPLAHFAAVDDGEHMEFSP